MRQKGFRVLFTNTIKQLKWKAVYTLPNVYVCVYKFLLVLCFNCLCLVVSVDFIGLYISSTIDLRIKMQFLIIKRHIG